MEERNEIDAYLIKSRGNDVLLWDREKFFPGLRIRSYRDISEKEREDIRERIEASFKAVPASMELDENGFKTGSPLPNRASTAFTFNAYSNYMDVIDSLAWTLPPLLALDYFFDPEPLQYKAFLFGGLGISYLLKKKKIIPPFNMLFSKALDKAVFMPVDRLSSFSAERKNRKIRIDDISTEKCDLDFLEDVRDFYSLRLLLEGRNDDFMASKRFFENSAYVSGAALKNTVMYESMKPDMQDYDQAVWKWFAYPRRGAKLLERCRKLEKQGMPDMGPVRDMGINDSWSSSGVEYVFSPGEKGFRLMENAEDELIEACGMVDAEIGGRSRNRLLYNISKKCGMHIDGICENTDIILQKIGRGELAELMQKEYSSYLFGSRRMKKEELIGDETYKKLASVSGRDDVIFRAWERNPKVDLLSPCHDNCCMDVSRRNIFPFPCFETIADYLEDPFVKVFNIEVGDRWLGNLYHVIGEKNGPVLYMDSIELSPRINDIELRDEITDMGCYVTRDHAEKCGFPDYRIGGCTSSKTLHQKFDLSLELAKKSGKNLPTDTFLLSRFPGIPLALYHRVPESYSDGLKAGFES